jgi:hypothetical protein
MRDGHCSVGGVDASVGGEIAHFGMPLGEATVPDAQRVSRVMPTPVPQTSRLTGQVPVQLQLAPSSIRVLAVGQSSGAPTSGAAAS